MDVDGCGSRCRSESRSISRIRSGRGCESGSGNGTVVGAGVGYGEWEWENQGKRKGARQGRPMALLGTPSERELKPATRILIIWLGYLVWSLLTGHVAEAFYRAMTHGTYSSRFVR